MRIFVSAGEASGDAYGAALVHEIVRLAPPSSAFKFEGLGGPRLSEAGVRLVAETNAWGAISIVQSFRVGPRVLLGYLASRRRLAHGMPGLFVPIDFGFINIRLARLAKECGWKVLYFVPPRSWDRTRQGRDLPAITDAISTPFSWSAELLSAAGANAQWFGHPIRQLVGDSRAVAERKGLAVLPGSRRHEIAENLPAIAAALRLLDAPQVEFGVAPSQDVAKLQARWHRLSPERSNDKFTRGDTAGVFRRARAAIVCSGTATLEAALLRCPMVVVYRVSRMMELEASLVRFKRPKYISLPNILLERSAVSELVQEAATPKAIAEQVRNLFANGPTRQSQLGAFDELETLLGPADSITRTAQLALSVISQTPTVD